MGMGVRLDTIRHATIRYDIAVRIRRDLLTHIQSSSVHDFFKGVWCSYG